MTGFARAVLVVLLAAIPALAADTPTIESTRATEDVHLTLDPSAPFWKSTKAVFVDKDRFGNPVHAYRTEVRTRWTKDNLYFLFICPYKELSLKPNPNTHEETNQLWNWEVAEAFIGSDFSDIQHYKEFEVSPQGEWIDLDIDLKKPHHEDGWTWNSGFEVLAKIDSRKAHLVRRHANSVQRHRHALRSCGQHTAHQSVSQWRAAHASLRHRMAADHEQDIPRAGEVRPDQTGRGG